MTTLIPQIDAVVVKEVTDDERIEFDRHESVIERSMAMAGRAIWLIPTSLDGHDQGPAIWTAMLAGAGLGLLWGTVGRIWMRLISTNHEFSIGGTAIVLGVPVLFGICTGLAFAVRRRGLPGWRHYVSRVLAGLVFIPFGIGAGAPLMLTVLVATLGIARTDWLLLIRRVLVLVAAVGIAVVCWFIVMDKPGLMALWNVAVYVVLTGSLVLGLRVAVAPRLLVPDGSSVRAPDSNGAKSNDLPE